jgi:DNA polymerase sigma
VFILLNAIFFLVSVISFFYQTSRFNFFVMCYSGVAEDVRYIFRARVPIVQYVSNRFGISCDVCVDNYLGRIKSKVLYWVNDFDERFGHMVLLV